MLIRLDSPGKKVRLLALLGLLFMLAGMSSDRANAASASLSPGIRYPCIGANASFSGTWGNHSPYEVLYDSDGGSPGGYYNSSTTSTGRSFSASYNEGTYYPVLEVWDYNNAYANDNAEVQSYSHPGCPF